MMKHVQKEAVETQYPRKNPHNPNNSNQNVAKKIKNYVFMLNDVIGKGSFSTVYRGQHQFTHEVVAIKVIDLKKMQSSALTDLLNSQVQTLQSLHHPNILHCQDIYFSASNCYIVTEFCNGGDLKQLLQGSQRALDEKTVSRIISEVYEGLKYLANRNIVHRDFKTTNVLMSNGRIKIADFGFAKKSRENFKDVVVGSPLCMSPEGILQNVYGPKTDVWAFGIFMFELLHRRNPFYFCQLQEELKHAVLQPIRESDLRPGLSLELKRLILDCLEIDPAKRISMKQIEFCPYMMKIKEESGNSQLLISIVEEYKVEKQVSIVSTQAPTANEMGYRNHFLKGKERRIQWKESPEKRVSSFKNQIIPPVTFSHLRDSKQSKKADVSTRRSRNYLGDERSVERIEHPRTRSFKSRDVQRIVNKSAATPQLSQLRVKTCISASSETGLSTSEFKDILALLHYSRLLFKTIKLCQKQVILNIDGLTSWLFQFLDGVIQRINRLREVPPNIQELRRIAHEYYVRYDNELVYTTKLETTPSKIKTLISDSVDILKASQCSSKRSGEVKEAIRHLEFLERVTELLVRARDSKDDRYFTEGNEIEEFLISKGNRAGY